MAFPSTPILDTFIRAPENPLSGGGQWANTPSGVAADANAQTNGTQFLSAAAQGTFSGNCWQNPSYGPSETYFDTPVTSGTARNDIYLVTDPTSGSASGYFVAFASSGATIWRLDSGATTSLITLSWDVAWAAGDAVGLSVSADGQIGFWHRSSSWVLVGSANDTSYRTQFYSGLDTTDTTARFANFGGGTSARSFSPQRMPLGV